MKITQMPADFISLNNKVLARYTFVFKVLPYYYFEKASDINHPGQLNFIEIHPKINYFNLIAVDSQFHRILSELALLAFLGKIKTFDDYLKHPDKSCGIPFGHDEHYLRYKLRCFLYSILYGDISNGKPLNTDFKIERIFCLRDDKGELQYYPAFEQQQLFDLLFSKLFLSINAEKIKFNSKTLTFKLKMAFSNTNATQKRKVSNSEEI